MFAVREQTFSAAGPVHQAAAEAIACDSALAKTKRNEAALADISLLGKLTTEFRSERAV